MTNMKTDDTQNGIDAKKQRLYQEFIANYLRQQKVTVTEDTDFTRLFLDILKAKGFIETVECDAVRQFGVLHMQVVDMFSVISRALQYAARCKLEELSKTVHIDNHRLGIELVTDTGRLCVERMHTFNTDDVEDGIGADELLMRKNLTCADVSFVQEMRNYPDYIVNHLQFRWKNGFDEQAFMNCAVTYMKYDSASGWSFRKDTSYHLFTIDNFWDIKYLFFDAVTIVARLASKAKLDKYSFAGKNYVAESIRYAKC